jgi:hypothetical protein
VELAVAEHVAKKQAKPTKPTKPEPTVSARKPMVVQIRGSQEWKEWVEAVARKEGFNLATLFERGVRKIAKDAGYPDPPMR